MQQSNQTLQSGRARRLWSWLLLIGVIGLIFASFFFDMSVWYWMRFHQTKPLLRFANFLSRYGDWPELMAVGAVLLLLTLWVGRRTFLRIVLSMIIASTLAGALVNTVRITSGRPRPNASEIPQGWYGLWDRGHLLLFKNKYHSFPSGHTAAAFGFFGILAFWKPRFGWIFLCIPAAIAWARVYLGAHHLSDVFVGLIIGLLAAWVTWRWAEPALDRWLKRRNAKRET